MEVEPYRVAAQLYRRAGWLGVVPLPPRKKSSPPPGWTGHSGAWPSGADVETWLDGPEATGNIALRLPAHIVGLDVDAYADKKGAQTFKQAQDLWGPLPPTWRSTSREHGQGAILLFRITEEGLAWPGELGPGVEVIQCGHRYVVAPPSIHPEGRTYRWERPPGAENVKLPRPEDLPLLPDSWVYGITSGIRAGEHRVAGFDSAQVTRWLLEHGQGEPCPLMSRTLETYEVRFAAGGSRHEAARDAVRRITGLAVDGHTGMTAALDHTQRVFRQVTRNDKTRPSDPHEWRRLLDGAVQLAATEETSTVDPCTVPIQMPTPAAAVIPHTGLLENVRNGAWLSRQTFPPLRHAVDGLIPEGYCLLVGAPKIGKSFMVLDLALAKSTGGKALGSLGVVHGPVFYLALEDGDRRMQGRCRMLRGDEPLPAAFEYIVTVPPTALMDIIGEWLTMHRDEQPLIILDTLGKVMPPSANGETTYQRDYRIGSQLKAMIDSAPGGSLIVNHHDRKASSADFVDAVSGTHGLAGAADTTIVVNRDRLSADGLIRVTGRDVREGQYAVTFSEGAWTLAGETLDAAQEAAAARSLMPATGSSDRTREVVQYVSAHPGCGSTDVEQALDLLAGQGRSYLKRLVDRGLIERLSLGRYGPLVPLLTVTDDSIGGVTPVTPVTPCVTPVPAGQKASVTPVTPVTPPPVTGPESRDTPPCVTGVTGVTERLRPAQTGVTHGVTPREGVTVNGQLLCTLCHRSDALIVFPDGPRCPEHYP